MSKQNPRDAQRLFASAKFRWLEQVARDSELPELAARFCILLCPLFNLEHDGVAWPKQSTMAQALNTRRERINEAVGMLVERGHLTSQRRGRDNPNHYRFVLIKEVAEQDHDVRHRAHLENHDVRNSRPRCTPGRTQTPSKTPGTPSASPGRESGAAPRGRAGARPEAGVGRELVPASGNGADRFDELRAVWKRPWPEDDAADRRAFEEACRHASFEAILSGARTWFAAADDARYLPPLARWLAGACWEKPPPKRVKRQQRGGKVDVAREMLVRAGLVEDDDAGRLQ